MCVSSSSTYEVTFSQPHGEVGLHPQHQASQPLALARNNNRPIAYYEHLGRALRAVLCGNNHIHIDRDGMECSLACKILKQTHNVVLHKYSIYCPECMSAKNH